MIFDKWVPSMEFLPPDDKVVNAWSEIYSCYDHVTFNPVFGWRDLNEQPVKSITHWLDAEITFPWKPRGEFDRDAYNKYAHSESDGDE